MVQLRSSGDYDRMTIGAVPTDKPRFIIIAACFEAFWDLPCNYMREIAAYLESPLLGTEAQGLITSIGTDQLPLEEQTYEVWCSIYQKRETTFEIDENSDELIELEYVLDCFNEGNKKNPENELKIAQSKHGKRSTFLKAFCDWKVCTPLSMTRSSAYTCYPPMSITITLINIWLIYNTYTRTVVHLSGRGSCGPSMQHGISAGLIAILEHSDLRLPTTNTDV